MLLHTLRCMRAIGSAIGNANAHIFSYYSMPAALHV